MTGLLVLLMLGCSCLAMAIVVRERVWVLAFGLSAGFALGMLVSAFQWFDALLRYRP